MTRLASIAASTWVWSISLRWTRALPSPSKVKITASGTKISGTTASPNSEGATRRASTTAETSVVSSEATRAIIVQRTPETAASLRSCEDSSVRSVCCLFMRFGSRT